MLIPDNEDDHYDYDDDGDGDDVAIYALLGPGGNHKFAVGGPQSILKAGVSLAENLFIKLTI